MRFCEAPNRKKHHMKHIYTSGRQKFTLVSLLLATFFWPVYIYIETDGNREALDRVNLAVRSLGEQFVPSFLR